jgi:hypothetical protein
MELLVFTWRLVNFDTWCGVTYWHANLKYERRKYTRLCFTLSEHLYKDNFSRDLINLGMKVGDRMVFVKD